MARATSTEFRAFVPAPSAQSSPLWKIAAPAVFVVLWSTGFIAAKAGLPFVEPLTFLVIRFVPVAALMLAVALATHAPWPDNPAQWGHSALVGVLMHGAYLGGVFLAIAHGMPAGIVSLIVGLQPILTAVVVGPLLGERVRPRQWLGLALGFGGVVLVLLGKLTLDGATAAAAGFALVALAGVTFGTLYQKRFCATVDLRSGAVIQYTAAGLALLPLALIGETMQVDWTAELVVAIAWLSFVLSVGTVSLLWVLVRRGAAARVASLFYLVPPITALFAWALFGETLGPVALAGMAVAATGVALVQKG